jgi:N-acetylneuraminic acid mutarotase
MDIFYFYRKLSKITSKMKNLYTTSDSKLFCIPLWILLVSLLSVTISWAQNGPPDRDTFKNKIKLKKKEPKLPKEDLKDKMKKNGKFNFKSSILREKESGNGRLGVLVSLSNPTSLQFGPDGKLYVALQNGLIKVYTIIRNAPNNYSISREETISLINQIPNHNDDGTLASEVNTRQVTSLIVAGTAEAPILYVSSSDSRIGGPSGDLNLDTNSGMISKLTRTVNGWDKTDLVRGLPRSEENHSNNGMQLDGTKLYIVTGGNTNAGSPSTNFAYTPEYALSTAVLSIDLAAIEAMPTQGSGVNKYKYDLPTLDDPNRAGNPDAGDPFGGNDGLNQAKIDPAGPVQVFATGFRNAYDLVITKTPGKPRRMFVTDNGANQGWGGHPANEGVGTATNNYVQGEPGSTTNTSRDAVVNNLDNLHYIGDMSTYRPGTFYGGHPNPTRANPSGAGLYTHANGVGVWRTTKTGTYPLPSDWPPLPLTMAHPIEGDFQNPGETDNALLTFNTSTNGIVEYTASGFNGTLKGHLLVASFDGTIHKITLDDTGSGVDNTLGSKRINQDLPIASNFGSEPIDLTTQGDNDIFPGTIWAACYGSNSIYVFEPEEATSCGGTYSTTIDDDGDGFSNADEIDNNTNPCSLASKPKDSDGDRLSDFNDPDDDNDTIADTADSFPLDQNNGRSTNLPLTYELFNNYPGTGLFGLGFTGLMLPKQSGFDYQDLFDEGNLVAGGAVGAMSVVSVSEGDPYRQNNNQENAFQFGVNVNSNTGPFTVRTRMLGPFFNGATPRYFQSQGVYIGTGDQDNYLKFVLGSDGGEGGLEMLYESNGEIVSNGFYTLPGGLPSSTMDLYLSVDPATGMVQVKYAKDGGQPINVGAPIALVGELLQAVKGTYTSALAVGILSTSLNSTPFTATWDMISVKVDAQTQADQAVVSFSLMNADNDQVIKQLTPGEQIDLYSLPTRNLSVRANVNTPAVGSVLMSLTGKQLQTQTESTAPYALFGDNNGDFIPWTPTIGTYTLTATPYTDPGGSGIAGNPLSLTFTVVDQAPLQGAWQTLVPASGSPTARHEAAYVQAGDKFYLMGGRGILPVQVYEPVGRSWTNAVTTPIEMHHFQAVALEGLVYVVGALTGSYPEEPSIPNVYIYNPAINKWFVGPQVPVSRRRGTAGVAVYNNKIYVVGGNTRGHNSGYVSWFDEFDPATNTWKVLPDAPHARDHFQAVIIGDKLYAAGGRRSSQNTGQTFMLTVPEVDIYDFTTGQWSTSTDPIPTQRAGTTTVALDGSVVVIGGESVQPTAHNETQAYSTLTNKWVSLANLQQGRHGTQAILNNGAIYIVAGAGTQGGSTELNSQEVFFKGGPTTPTGTLLSQSNLTSPSSGAFGRVAVNSAQSSLIKLTNSGGNQSILVTGISLSGSSEFSFQSPITVPFIIPVGQSVDIKVDFKALSSGKKAATLNIAHSGASSSLSVSLTGEGVSGTLQSIANFSLINADNDQVIRVLANNDIINLPGLPSPRINIQANTNPVTVGSVQMTLNGPQNQTVWENVAPYALFGDVNGNLNAWVPAVGTYTLNATPYSSASGGGTAGSPLQITFTVTNNAGGKIAAESEVLTEPGRGWHFFPNPTSGVIRLEFEADQSFPLTITIIDMMGRSVLNERRESLENVTLNLHSFQPGLYLIRVSSKAGTFSRKLLKQ